MRTDRIGRFEGVATILVSIVAGIALYAACRPWWSSVALSALDLAQRLAGVAGVLPFLAIAVFIASRSKDHRANNTLALSLALFSANGAFALLSEARPPGIAHVLSALTYITYWSAAATCIRAAQLFPSPIRRADLDTFALRMPRLAPVKSLLAVLLHPLAPWLLTLAILAVSFLIPATHVPGNLLIMFVEVGYYFVQWQIGSARRRRKITWLIQIVITYILAEATIGPSYALLSFAGASAALPYVQIAWNFALAVTASAFLAIGVFRAGAIHPGLIVRRTIVYGIATWLLLFALEVALHAGVDVIKETLGISDRFIAAVLGTIVGLLFAPLAKRIKVVVDGFISAKATQ